MLGPDTLLKNWINLDSGRRPAKSGLQVDSEEVEQIEVILIQYKYSRNF